MWQEPWLESVINFPFCELHCLGSLLSSRSGVQTLGIRLLTHTTTRYVRSTMPSIWCGPSRDFFPDLINLWNKPYKHELFCVREQWALDWSRVSSKEKSRPPGTISGEDRRGGAVTQQRWDAPNVGEILWFRFARITGREILGPERDRLTLLGKNPRKSQIARLLH